MCAHTCAVMHSNIWIWIHRTLSGSGPPHLVLEQRLSCFCSTVLLFRPLWVLLSPSHTHIKILHTASRRPTPSHNLTWVLRTKLKLSILYRVCSYPLEYPTTPQYIFWKFVWHGFCCFWYTGSSYLTRYLLFPFQLDWIHFVSFADLITQMRTLHVI